MTFTQKFKCGNCGKIFTEEIQEGMLIENRAAGGIRLRPESIVGGKAEEDIECPRCGTKKSVRKHAPQEILKPQDRAFIGVGM